MTRCMGALDGGELQGWVFFVIIVVFASQKREVDYFISYNISYLLIELPRNIMLQFIC